MGVVCEGVLVCRWCLFAASGLHEVRLVCLVIIEVGSSCNILRLGVVCEGWLFCRWCLFFFLKFACEAGVLVLLYIFWM